jgi:hypothetical protein
MRPGLSPAVVTPPVSVLYGGAHRFSPDTPRKLAGLARAALATWAPDPDTFARAVGAEPARAEALYAAVRRRLEGPAAVDDLRIDFEDGYGPRADDEEDGHAHAAGVALAACRARGLLPPRIGIRVKAWEGPTAARARRTLERFLHAYLDAAGAPLPPGFVVTLPKVGAAETVRRFVDALSALEGPLGLAEDALGVELMVETPRGLLGLLELATEAGHRLDSLHLGAYDLLSALGVLPMAQGLGHPHCVDARGHIVRVAAALGVRAVDGATTRLPLPVHRAEGEPLSEAAQRENHAAVVGAWRAHADAVRAACWVGVWQGWDLHPAQLPARYGALFDVLAEGVEDTVVRLANFVSAAAQATRVGQAFDDAATARGLAAHLARAASLGVVDASAVEARVGASLDRSCAGEFVSPAV